MNTALKIKVTLGYIALGWFILFARPNTELDITRHIAIFALINFFAAIKVHFWLREITQ
tara:strand:- start:44 stop:220 length:177 start_codon:yes stop_codon:yes gene_type:complete